MRKGLISAISVFTGMAVGSVIGAIATGKITAEAVDRYGESSDRHLELFQLMNQWVRTKQDGKRIDDYLIVRGYRSVAIYGMSYVGETLQRELKESKVDFRYGIDKTKCGSYSEWEIFSADDKLPEVDAIIVTAITYYDEIKNQLGDKMSCPILSLKDILYEI